MTHDEALDLIPLALLDTLDAADRARLTAHVSGCDSCRATYLESGQAVDALGRSVPQVEPPASLRARVLANATRSAGAVTAPAGTATPVPAPATPRITPSSSRWSWALPLAASLVAAIAMTGWFMARTRLEDAYATIASLREALSTSEAARVRAEQAAAGQQLLRAQYERTVEVLGARNLRQVALSGLPPAADARARAYMSDTGLLLSAEGLPPLPSGQVYQLWLVVGSTPFSAGTFAGDASGRAQLVAPLPTPDAPAALAVTVEPTGGVPAPTGPKYLLGVPSN